MVDVRSDGLAVETSEERQMILDPVALWKNLLEEVGHFDVVRTVAPNKSSIAETARSNFPLLVFRLVSAFTVLSFGDGDGHIGPNKDSVRMLKAFLSLRIQNPASSGTLI